jgi:predicted Zn finger-like uncharacterized protein
MVSGPLTDRCYRRGKAGNRESPMQIVCPSCQTSYQIAEMAVGASGRQVRCVRCQNVWHAAPPAAAPALADEASMAAFRAELSDPPAPPELAAEPPPEPAAEPPLDDLVGTDSPEPAEQTTADSAVEATPVALSEIPIPVEPAAEFTPLRFPLNADQTPPDIESVAARRARPATRKRRSRIRLPLAAAIAALMLISAAAIGFRKEAVRHAPQLASFYSALGMPVNLRGLAFADLKIGNEIHDGVPVLVIEGTIVSTTSKTVDLPRLRFALRSASGAEVYSWTAPPTQPTLSAFETLAFRSRLASPPAEGHDIQVRFFTRRDAVASLR